MRAAHTAMLGLAALAISACGDPRRGEVIVNWTFAGQDCRSAGVQTIRFDIPGEVLTPNEYPCVNADNSVNTGAHLGFYFFNTYTLTVSGLDTDRVVLYEGSQTFTVNGDVNLNIDLQRQASTFATADVSWSPFNDSGIGGFAPGTNGGMTCSEAQVDTVRVFVDGVSAGDVPCESGGVEGALVSPLTAGNHSFTISAFRGASGTLTLVYQSTTTVSQPFQIGATTLIDVEAASVGSGIGSASLIWGTGCSGTVTYTLTDPTGAAIQNTVSCSQSVPLSNKMAGLWIVDATSGTLSAHQVPVGVPNGATAAPLTINFSSP